METGAECRLFCAAHNRRDARTKRSDAHDDVSSFALLPLQPFRAHVPMDRTVASQTWEALANAIDEIYDRNASQLSFEELYRNAYNLVLHKHGTLLYEGVSEKLSSHLLDTVSRLAEVADSSLLEEMASIWSEHQVCERVLRRTR